MSTRDRLIVTDPLLLPEALREPVAGVSFAAYLCVEAARLDGLPDRAVLAWLGVTESTFARAEERWDERLSDELAREGAELDAMYDDLLGRALSLWHRAIDPLDRDVAAWIAYQRRAGDTPDLGRERGLTLGDELRLARLWRGRVTDPEVATVAVAAWSAPLPPMPALVLSPLVFPPATGPV